MTSEIAFNDRLLTRLEYRRDWSTASVFPPHGCPVRGFAGHRVRRAGQTIAARGGRPGGLS
jgi:hypothetical protein